MDVLWVLLCVGAVLFLLRFGYSRSARLRRFMDWSYYKKKTQ